MSTPERIYASFTPMWTNGSCSTWRRATEDIEYIHSNLFPRWVKIEERSPKKDGQYPVLITLDGLVQSEWDWWGEGQWRTFNPEAVEDAGIVLTHWLEGVPPIPTEDK